MDHKEDNARGPIIPLGFTMVPSGGDDFIIHHMRGGMGCMNIFLIVWLAGWSFGCVALLRQYLNGGKMENGGPIPLWFVCVFWEGEVVVACLLTYLLFSKNSFRTDAAYLGVDTVVLGLRRSRPYRGIQLSGLSRSRMAAKAMTASRAGGSKLKPTRRPRFSSDSPMRKAIG